MNELREKITAALADIDSQDTQRGIAQHSSALVDEFLRTRGRLEVRQGEITDGNGKRIDVTSALNVFLDASPLVLPPSDRQSGYISPWSRPNERQRKAQVDETERVIKKLAELNGLVPIEPAYFEKAVGILAQNYLHEIKDGEVYFGRYTASGVIPDLRLSFDALIGSINHLVDKERSAAAGALREAALKRTAKDLLPASFRPQELEQKVKELKRNEVNSVIPRRVLPRIPRSDVEREIVRRETIKRGLQYEDVMRAGGQRVNMLNRIAKHEYDEMLDFSAIDKELKALQPPPPRHEGLTYYGTEA